MLLRKQFAVSVALVAGLQGIGEKRLQAQTVRQATFKTSAELVLVPITVTNHFGKTVSGLRAENFTVLEDGKPQTIVSFANEEAPCSVGVVLDISGSMQTILGTAKETLHSFFKTTNPDDEALLLTVSTKPDEVSGFTSDVASLETNVAATRPGGMTSLIDTVYLGLSHMRRAKWHRRALLVVSDGMDNHSRYSKAELMRVALEADVQIYAVIIDNPSVAGTQATLPMRPTMVRKPWDQGAERQGRDLLEELSNRTGGLYFHVRTSDEANDAALKSAQALRHRYVIGFQPQTPQDTGKWHRIRVKSNVPDSHIYARNGYYSH